MLLLPVVLGCHPSSEVVHAAQDQFDEMLEADHHPIDPEIIAAQRACDDQHDMHACMHVPRRQSTGEVRTATHSIAAVAKQDAAAFAKLVADEVTMSDLWFDDPDCAKQFAGSVALTTALHPAFLRCLAKAAIHIEPASNYPSPPSLAYKPDMRLAVEIRDGAVQQIYAFSSSKKSPPLSRIVGEEKIVPDPDTKNAISVAGNPRLIGSFKLCITAHGTIASVTLLQSTEAIAYDRTIERKLYSWKY